MKKYDVRCACGEIVNTYRPKLKIYGTVRDKPAIWAECPNCHKAVGPAKIINFHR